MRLFFSVPLEDSVRAQIADKLANLRGERADVKWVERDNLHLTLAFLGETPPSALPALEAALRQAAGDRFAFDFAFDGMGVFDSWARPRVIWLGLSVGQAELSALAAVLRQSLAQRGLFPDEPDRPFRAHLTLGRFRTPRGAPDLEKAARSLGPLNVAARARRVALVSSRLSPAGPVYFDVLDLDLRR